jgi:hypothetical protein
MIAGSATGGAVVCLALFTATSRGPAGLPAVFPALAGVGGLAAGALVAWSLSRPVANLYYRAALAMLGVFGTALIGALAVPAHVVAGRWGLAALGALCIVALGVALRPFTRHGA